MQLLREFVSLPDARAKDFSREAPQLADATARISRRILTTYRYTFRRARKISVSESLYATPVRAAPGYFVWA